MAHVLIVDDDFDIADLTKDLLESAGHQIRVGHDGVEGLVSLSHAPLPDCVLLDVDMPGVDGPEMAHQMLLHDAGEEKIPILLVSGRDDLSDIATRMGTPYFLRKATPDYAKLLINMLDRALIEGRAPASA